MISLVKVGERLLEIGQVVSLIIIDHKMHDVVISDATLQRCSLLVYQCNESKSVFIHVFQTVVNAIFKGQLRG